jgi:hypothetical protein
MSRIGRRALLAGVALTALLFANDDPARADGAPRAEVLVIHAASVPGGGSMDPRLIKLSRLRNVPFNGYNTFKLLDTQTLPLAKSGPSLALKNGYHLSLSLTSIEGRQLHIVPSLSKTATPNPLPEVSAKADEPFFVAGQSYEGGILIIAVTPRL